MAIEAKHLTVHRLGRPVLRDVSLAIGEGEVVSIIGPNGAGKSTLMAALLGLVPPSSGMVHLDDSPIHRLHRRQIARRVAYVPQMHDGYLGFTVREIVEGGRYAHLDPLAPLSETDRRMIASAAAAADVTELLDRSVDTLSGGERQKVWIAAALAQATPMLFLDEPTNALDPAHQVELIRIMRRFVVAKDSGTPVAEPSGARPPRDLSDTPAGANAAGKSALRGNSLLVISHDLNLPLALGGRVLALSRGNVAFDAPVSTLLDEGRLENLFGTRFVIHRGDNDEVSIHVRV